MSLVNQKMSLKMSLQDIAIFIISQKCLYIIYIWTLEDALKNGTILVTICFKDMFQSAKKYDCIAYRGKLRKYL
jgi:predicted RNase H-related nuclease YkuK (DUF458 family)